MAHGVIITSLLTGTTDGARLVSLKYSPSDTDTAIDNGCVVVLDSLYDATNDRELWKAVTPAANSKIKDIAIVATPEVSVNGENVYDLGNFYNVAGAECRGFRLVSGNCFDITADVLDGTLTSPVGMIVELQAGVKLKAVTSATASTTTIGKIIDTYTKGNKTFYVVCVD